LAIGGNPQFLQILSNLPPSQTSALGDLLGLAKSIDAGKLADKKKSILQILNSHMVEPDGTLREFVGAPGFLREWRLVMETSTNDAQKLAQDLKRNLLKMQTLRKPKPTYPRPPPSEIETRVLCELARVFGAGEWDNTLVKGLWEKVANENQLLGMSKNMKALSATDTMFLPTLLDGSQESEVLRDWIHEVDSELKLFHENREDEIKEIAEELGQAN